MKFGKYVFFFIALFFISNLSISLNARESVESLYGKAQALSASNRHFEAAKLFEKTGQLVLEKAQPRYPYAGMVFQLAGFSYYKSQQYERALACYEKSASAFKMGGINPVHLANMKAQVQSAMNDEVGALASYVKRISDIRKEKPHDDDTLRYMLDLTAANLFTSKKNDEALTFFQQNSDIDRKLGNLYALTVSLKNIGNAYLYKNNYILALAYYTQALESAKKMMREDEVGNYLKRRKIPVSSAPQIIENREYEYYRVIGRIGILDYTFGNYKQAAKSLARYIASREKMLDTLMEKDKKSWDIYTKDFTYHYLVSAYIRGNNLPKAYETIEKNHARQLRNRLSGKYQFENQIVSLKKLQNKLDSETALVMFSNVGGDLPVAQLVVTDTSISGHEIARSRLIRRAVDHYRDDIKAYIKSNQFTEQLRSDDIVFEDVVNYYVNLLINPENTRGFAITGRGKVTKEVDKPMDAILFDSLIEPVADAIKDKKKLVIIPDGYLGVIPFETLVNHNGKYLIERFEISYAHSASVLELINKREYQKARPLLAFGGAVYDRLDYNKKMIDSRTQWEELLKNVHISITKGESLRGAYAAFGYTWSNLPGTLAEVNSIAEVVDKATLYTGPHAAEGRVKHMSAMGELSKYKVIHFATHGISIPFAPELSSIVLSLFKNGKVKEDGYLSMHEIVDLDLKAEFVNLSACNTGLGRIYGGEGVVGLTQAFLLAGANGLSVSLWQVGDVSTSEFMVGLYMLTEKHGIGYRQAMNEMKRKFIKGDFGEKYTLPFYWAPFVYYGK